MEEKPQKRLMEVSADEKGHLIQAVDRQEAKPERGKSSE